MKKVILLICILFCLCLGAKKSNIVKVEICNDNNACFATVVEDVKNYKNITVDNKTFIRFTLTNNTVVDLDISGKTVKIYK